VLVISSLKEEFLDLLERDREFRYAVIGYLGLDRIEKTQMTILEEIRKLWEEVKALREGQERLWEGQKRLWEEVKALREGQEKLWESQKRLWEEVRRLWEEVKSLREGQNKLWKGQEKLWEEVRALREGQERLWEENRRIWEEIKALREGQEKLWEGQKRLWEEVRALREGQNKLWEENRRIWEEIRALREGQNKLWEEVRALREGQERLWKDQRRLWRYVKSGFEGVREALGASFEEYVASFTRFMLYELGYTDVKVEVRKYMMYEGRMVEINLFSEEPLVVGEVTLRIRDVSEADREVGKLVERTEIVSKIYGRKPYMKILAIGNAPEEVIEYLKKLTTKYDIRLIIGRELREVF